MNKTEHVLNLCGFKSFQEADDFRGELKHKDLYGLYGIRDRDGNELWCVMPLKVLTQIVDFDESKG